MKIPNIPNTFSISNLPYISLTSFNIFVAVFPFQTARHEFQNIPIWAEDQCETLTFSSSCSTHTVKYTCNSQLTMSIIRMLLLFTKLLQLGLKALTQLSLQPVSLEQEELPCRQFCFGWFDCISRCSHRRNFWWRTVSHLVNWGYLSNSYYSQRKHLIKLFLLWLLFLLHWSKD